MLDVAFAGFLAIFLALGLRRPFLWVLAYLYVDIVAPQKISYFLLASLPVSLIVFVLAFGGWVALDNKQGSRFTLRQGIMLILLLYCGYTTMGADFPEAAAEKWSWVWKALVFALFLPLALRTRLRIEAAALVMVLSAASIIITGGIKTAMGGGGYGANLFYINDNTGLYESSIISCVAIAIIPLVLWLSKHGTVFAPDRRVKLFAWALIFSCALIPVGTQARTGLVCLGLLCLMALRTAKRRLLYTSLMAAAALIAIPFLPQSFTARMGTIENHEADESASTRVAVWAWTWDYAKDHPLGGGFDAYLGNSIRYRTRVAKTDGNTTAMESAVVTDKARAYHSSYFEMLGEQGYTGFLLWIWLHLLGIWQMERLRRRWKDRAGPGEQWQAPLANALQQAQVIYLCGSLFVGIAYQPFILMLVGLQCALWTYLRRIDAPRPRAGGSRAALRPLRPVAAAD